MTSWKREREKSEGRPKLVRKTDWTGIVPKTRVEEVTGFSRMGLVRILVDGYSLLHSWPEVAPGWARHSEAAREELMRVLTLFQDVDGTPVTVVFDGRGAKKGTPHADSTREMEVLFSGAGRTADDLIERAACRFRPYGEVLVVTYDRAERQTVASFGGSVASCMNFIGMVNAVLGGFDENLRRHNRSEQTRFRGARQRRHSL